MFSLIPRQRFGRLLVISVLVQTVAACGGGAPTAPVASAALTSIPTGATSPGGSGSGAASPTGSSAPEPSGATIHGDIPDNAVFLTYHGTTPAFSIQYVEGWQVTQQPNGVVIRDKDSSETVTVVAPQGDVPAYVASTDLRGLQAQAGFALVRQDTVTVGGSSYVHLTYNLPALPDPVTGKQVPSSVDRYYVPGPAGLAVVSLSTPNGVDNVDAFRQMIASFRWS